MRNKIWISLINSKHKGNLLDLLIYNFQRKERVINIFIALTSSGSIAAWAIWKKYEIIWGVIIAMSQIVTVLKPYFPYHRYIKELNIKSLRADILSIDLEQLWDDYEKCLVSDEEASKLYYKYRKEMADIFRLPDELLVKISKSTKLEADSKTRLFLKNNYDIEVTIQFESL